MNALLTSLKSYIILSLNDLSNIRNTISRRYSHLSSNERAEILSMAVHNHLDKHLSGIEASHKNALKVTILAATLAKHNYSISRHDVFESIFELDLSETIKIELAESWLIESVQIPVPRWALEDYLHEKHQVPRQVAYKVKKIKPAFKFSFHLNYEMFNRFMAKYFLKIALGVLILVGISTLSMLFSNQPFVKTKSFIFETRLNDLDYKGLSALDRVYLIDSVDGYTEGDRVTLTLEKSVYHFGLYNGNDAFKYEHFDYFAVKNYISNARNGLIGASEHFNQVIHKAYLNDIDPLLLLAIIGQEQAFIPKESVERAQMINNPYNVYHSWIEYNTTLSDSTQIAINTIKNRLNTVPKGISSLKWLNETYAEDENWHNGVQLIYSYLISIGR